MSPVIVMIWSKIICTIYRCVVTHPSIHQLNMSFTHNSCLAGSSSVPVDSGLYYVRSTMFMTKYCIFMYILSYQGFWRYLVVIPWIYRQISTDYIWQVKVWYMHINMMAILAKVLHDCVFESYSLVLLVVILLCKLFRLVFCVRYHWIYTYLIEALW